MKYVFAVIATLFFALPAHAQTITPGEQDVIVNNIQNYLNGITTMQADFSQLSQDGQTETGKFYLSRPGRMRFEYNENGDYIVADGLLVHYWDNGVKNYSNAPIGATLADFLLRKKIIFNDDIKVVTLKRPADNKLLITFTQAKHPEMGDLRMLFNEDPLQLEKWRVTDGAGSITEVTLSNVQAGGKLDPRLFVFKAPKGFEQKLNSN
jgi:outer membrane lipoprotein-sorting protein